jgi:hypothetical protein
MALKDFSLLPGEYTAGQVVLVVCVRGGEEGVLRPSVPVPISIHVVTQP